MFHFDRAKIVFSVVKAKEESLKGKVQSSKGAQRLSTLTPRSRKSNLVRPAAGQEDFLERGMSLTLHLSFEL
jgi:hypothetical protein